ncbi:hypothetical protein PAXRUDRAFT_758254 [Paxillus rubicundulus Ve08.2h10]|uniref:Unplaced genomic scaffold scaffold_98, whole genome shotgun sequence n=1 Tax=Paxillus rubicundulus Ve08.2h10 TaxID=930991 RepID=A0A0D0EBK8_9AGAM|nr:hypothetical protein PAXRUDRAFT_758254 [Paxillus rubicundulus Ve08.2h10]
MGQGPGLVIKLEEALMRGSTLLTISHLQSFGRYRPPHKVSNSPDLHYMAYVLLFSIVDSTNRACLPTALWSLPILRHMNPVLSGCAAVS